MREGLRSSGWRKDGQVDSGPDVGDLEGVKVPDLNGKGEPDVVLSGGAEKFCCEVSKNNGVGNGSLCGVGFGEEESKGMEDKLKGEESRFQRVKFSGVNDSGRKAVEGVLDDQVGGNPGKLQSSEVEETFYDCCENLGGATDIGGEGQGTGVEGLNCAVGDADQVVALSSMALEHVDKDVSFEEAKEKDLQSNMETDDKASSLQRVETIGTDHNRGVSTNKSSYSGFDNVWKVESKEEHVDGTMNAGQSDPGAVIEGDEKVVGCKFDEDDKGESLKMETEQGRAEVIGKVLRSRVVPANGEVAGDGQVKAAHWKTKKGIDSRAEIAVTVKEESDKSAVDSERVRRRGRPPRKSIDISEEDVVQINGGQVVFKPEAEDVNKKSVKPQKKKGKRGRPKKSIDHPEEEVLQLKFVPFLSESEDEELDYKTPETPSQKRKRGRPKKSVDPPEGKVVQVKKSLALSEVEDEDLNSKPVRSTNKKRKRGRPRKSLDSPDGEVDCDVDEAGDVGKKSSGNSEPERKRGRPKKYVASPGEEVVQVKKVPFHDDEDEFEYESEELCDRPVIKSKKKRKRGRPKKEGGSGALERTFHHKGKVKNDTKSKGSLVTSPVRRGRRDSHSDKMHKAPSAGVLSSGRKISSAGSGVNVVRFSSKGQESPVTKNDFSKKYKRVEKFGSVSAEKNSIRNQIVNMLLAAGWTVEYRPRQGRQYNDAVYVNREGKTHWSVTKAYYSLKQDFDEGKLVSKATKSNFSFTPIPEEILSKLFRVVSKTRCDKNKKKRHKDSDETDEETGAKHRKRKSSQSGSQSKRRCALLVRRSKNSESDAIIAHSGKHSILAWMIDSSTVPLNGKVHYMNRRRTRPMLEGSIARDGIHCFCCKEVISVVEFERHAGSRFCAPYENLYLESGSSLLQCQLDSWNKQEEAGRSGFHSVPVDGDDPNDDTCGICGDGGELVCCDGCPSTFHHECLDVEEFPSGEWHCVYCSCKFCGDVIEPGSDSDDDREASLSLVSCSLCEEKYHQSCIVDEDVCAKPGKPTFCGRDCEQIYAGLQSLVGANCDLGDGFSFTILQRSDVQADASTLQAQKILSNSKLAVALSIMDECFLPILDHRSGINLIRHIVYSSGSNFKRLNFSRFFTVVLERGDEVICAASIRIRGKQLAEMPFIGTRNVYRRQGMCRRLLNAIEMALASLDVENLVIPAIPELMQTWTSVFGFKPLDESIKEDLRSMSMLVFPHTDMLQKPLSKHQLGEENIGTAEEDVKCVASSGNAEHIDCGADKSEVDDGYLNGTIDLNSTAPNLPESPPDESNLVHPGIKVEAQPEEPPAIDSSEEKALKPALNLMEESVCEDDVIPDSLNSVSNEKERDVTHPIPETLNSDPVVRTTSDSSGGTHVEEKPALENGRGSHEGRTLNFDLNLVEENGLDFSKLP